MAHCDSYYGGQCTWGACQLASWIPDGLGDGGDWAGNYSARGGAVTMSPTAGSVVCYCRGDGYSGFGHVAYVEQLGSGGTFLVKEMNYVAAWQWDERWSSMGDVCGFLLAPGMAPGSGGGGQGAGPSGVLTASIPWQLQGAWNNVRWWSLTGRNNEVNWHGHLAQAFGGIPG